MSGPRIASASTLSWASGNVRWRVCAMLLCATTINYIDRQVLGVLAPFLQEQIGWTEIEYSYIVTAFQAAYAIGLRYPLALAVVHTLTSDSNRLSSRPTS